MHRYGSMDIAARIAGAPRLARLGGEAWALKGAQVLDCRMEIDASAGDALIPPSLRPGLPSYGGISVMRVAESPAGPFGLAELRIGVRAGAIASWFVLGAICDSEAAAAALAEGWGYPVRPGEVEIEDLYHQVTATARLGGRQVLRLKLRERHALPGTRMNVPSVTTLAEAPDGRPVLVNAPVSSAYASADGGPQALEAFDAAAFGAGDAFLPRFPMGAAFGTAEITLGAPAFLIDPERPAEESVEPVAA